MKQIKCGYTGKEVDMLNRHLSLHGITATDGDTFTDTTMEAVMQFQAANGLSADGIVGYRTWEALFFNNRMCAKRLTDDDFIMLAMLLDCEAAALKAVCQVETSGRGGFIADGKPVILFEGHIFWEQLRKRGLDPRQFTAGNENILYPTWNKRYYSGGIREYERLEQARRINREAADASASWGMFQIMGFNYAACGENSVADFVDAMSESELKQLLLSGRFIRRAGMLPALQSKNWAEFARKYNGPAYAQNSYDLKLTAAYRRLADNMKPIL